MVLNKAQMVANKNHKVLRSAFSSIPWPSVIRLNKYIQVPYKKVILTRKNILKRDMYKCAYCGRSDLPLTIDHVVPRARGGEDSWENLVAACIVCNNRKGNKSPEEVGLVLRVKPYKPNHIMFMANMGRIEDSWKPFLFQ